MLKIAVASEKGKVAGHFGHCPEFIIFTSENGKITAEETVKNPGHRKGFLPDFLDAQKVNTIISGGMGKSAIDLFDQKNIEVITGASGSPEEAAKAYLEGTLESSGSVCHRHMHQGSCDEHED